MTQRGDTIGVPWLCPRFHQLYKKALAHARRLYKKALAHARRLYKKALAHARRHAAEGDCALKKQRKAAEAVTKPATETGRVRRATWLSENTDALEACAGYWTTARWRGGAKGECDHCSGQAAGG